MKATDCERFAIEAELAEQSRRIYEGKAPKHVKFAVVPQEQSSAHIQIR